MFRRPLRTLSLLGILALVFASPALAHTYTVGPGSGTDFPDIPSAIAASQPGDVLLVQPATYAGGFTLDKGLTIIGYGAVQLVGDGVVVNIPSNQRATIVHLALVGLTVQQCTGPIVLQELTTSGAVAVTSCTDARLFRVTSTLPPLPTATCLTLSGSRVELAQSSFSGSDAGSSGTYGGADGGPGIISQSGSRMDLVLSTATGGGGQQNSGQQQYAGDGAPGVETQPTTQLIIAGGAIHAGVGGYNFNPFGDCCLDGNGTMGVWNFPGSQTWYSGGSIVGTDQLLNCTACTYFQWGPFYFPNLARLVAPPDPTLSATGTFSPTTTSTLTLQGPAGSHASLRVGRHLTVVADPSTRIETLVDGARTFDLGVIPAGGMIDFPVHDSSWPAGAFLAAQATVVLPGGEIRRTNSIPMVFR